MASSRLEIGNSSGLGLLCADRELARFQIDVLPLEREDLAWPAARFEHRRDDATEMR
jgi:hypothetical protein